ncbi:MAG: signal transduction protein [Thermoplasmata archaeon]|nr:MAG: signal transduction protein [Thermoplasmata archaeon]
MFKDTIEGLDEVFFTDVEPPMVVIVRGPPGSMKSTFIHMLLAKYLEKRQNDFALYISYEETVRSQLKMIKRLGIDISLNLQISDLSDIRKLKGDKDTKVNYLDFTEKLLTHYKQKHGDEFSVFALDSLGALYSLILSSADAQEVRRRMYHFFEVLRDNNLVAFIIMESSLEGESKLLGDEGFLSDGIIMLGLRRKQGKLIRYLQVEKMRAVHHSMEMHAMDIQGNNLIVMGPIFDD